MLLLPQARSDIENKASEKRVAEAEVKAGKEVDDLVGSTVKCTPSLVLHMVGAEVQLHRSVSHSKAVWFSPTFFCIEENTFGQECLTGS